jgi:hypothetical protein
VSWRRTGSSTTLSSLAKVPLRNRGKEQRKEQDSVQLAMRGLGVCVFGPEGPWRQKASARVCGRWFAEW